MLGDQINRVCPCPGDDLVCLMDEKSEIHMEEGNGELHPPCRSQTMKDSFERATQ